MENRANTVTYELMFISREPSQIALELVKGVLLRNGIGLQKIVETDEKPFHRLSVFFGSSEKARSLKDRLRQLKIKNVSVRIKELVKEDWFNKWKKEFREFPLTASIRVVPAWDKKAARSQSNGGVLVLDTGFAFGTGMHPTTKYMAQLIEQSRGCFGRFLDIGTGSGILSLVALKNGAVSVEAIDISRDAVEAANANFERNGFGKIKARKADIAGFKPGKSYDFVAANLITQDLIRLKKKLCRLVKKGRYLAVSGISINNLPILKKEFRTLPLKCIKIFKGEGWSAIKYKRL